MTKNEVIRLLDEKIEAAREEMNERIRVLVNTPGSGIVVDDGKDGIQRISEQFKVVSALREVRDLTIGAYPDPPATPVEKAELLQ